MLCPQRRSITMEILRRMRHLISQRLPAGNCSLIGARRIERGASASVVGPPDRIIREFRRGNIIAGPVATLMEMRCTVLFWL
jgi:hypothetical protein